MGWSVRFYEAKREIIADAIRAIHTGVLSREKHQILAPRTLGPPISSNLDPLDFPVWSRMMGDIITVRYNSVSELKEAIKMSWRMKSEDNVKVITGRFRSRIECVLNEG